MGRLLKTILFLGAFLVWSAPGVLTTGSGEGFVDAVLAQGQARAILYPADATAFPAVSTFLDVFDASGRFVSGIQPQQVTVYEDGQPVAPQSVTEMVVPLQLTVAINPGPALVVRDELGKLRFENVVAALSAWAQALPADSADDMSLVTLSGPIISHASARDWLVSLQAVRPEFRDTTPNLQSLQIAIETISVQPPRVGMKRAVLFITPHMDDADIDAQMAPLIQLALQRGVRVFVWFTDTELYSATASATAFNNLAMQTGGAYFAATELQPFPDPETYFAPLRRLYGLEYQSPARTSGEHKLSVEVTGQAGSVRSPEQAFTIDLQPPNPIFVTPPLQLVRNPPADDPYNADVLLPETQPLEIIVEFPDGHQRPLVRTTLYVDGEIAAENTAEPFNTFVWDLTQYAETGEHKLIAEAVDTLGLSRTSIEIPVTLTVVQAPRGPAAIFARYRNPIIIGAIAFAGVVLLLILFMGRLRGLVHRTRTVRAKQADPVTQIVSEQADIPTVASAPRGTGRTKPVAAGTTAKQAATAPAFLRKMQPDPLAAPGETFKPTTAPPIPLLGKEITFGTDPKQSSQVLHDPSLEPRHARITRTESGDFFVVDAGTIGGTWVNFEPVGQEAHLLRHGDVLHFGQLVFRFELREPPEPSQPTVTKLPPEQ